MDPMLTRLDRKMQHYSRSMCKAGLRSRVAEAEPQKGRRIDKAVLIGLHPLCHAKLERCRLPSYRSVSDFQVEDGEKVLLQLAMFEKWVECRNSPAVRKQAPLTSC